ncbi:hypothetical protein ACFO3A_08465 [Comamonas nitrativorans]|uniref:Uncharacterized protein n=1 Tax=Comamonas nitrativorans TaxID=108437 RepID=A0ABV9GW76_9BURK
MLESSLHQGSSLRWYTRGLRVLSIIPSGEAEDLSALWSACAVLQEQGYPVVILDGLEQETDQAPGLQDILQGHADCGSTALSADITRPHAIASLPAARGLVQLAHLGLASGQRPLSLLYRHLRNHALVVLLAPAPLLAPVLQGIQQAPWVLVPGRRSSVVPCYRALKHMFMHTGVMPQLLALRPAHTGLDPLLKSIAQCAHHHLRTEPLAQQVDPGDPRGLQRWALQCLEQSQIVAMPGQAAAPLPFSAPSPALSSVWNH